VRIWTAAFLALLLPGPAGGEEVPRTLVFEGTLRTGAGDPVEGVYRLRFFLAAGAEDSVELWSEQLPVALDRGRFQVELGRRQPFPPGLELGGLWLAASHEGQVLLREAVDPRWVSGVRGDGAPIGPCARALLADNSARVAGLDLDQLKALLARTLGPGGKRRLTGTAGTTEGESFTLECPPGHMVTGLEGAAGDGVRGLRLICSPMEAR